MGLAQHHDAISGTERQDVADDYVLRLSQGIDAALVSHSQNKDSHFCLISQEVINQAYTKLLPKNNQSLSTSPHFLCPLLNISECLPIEHQHRVILISIHNCFHHISQISSHSQYGTRPFTQSPILFVYQ